MSPSRETRMCQKRKKTSSQLNHMPNGQTQSNSASTALFPLLLSYSISLCFFSPCWEAPKVLHLKTWCRKLSQHKAALIAIYLHKKMMQCLISKCPHLSSPGEKWYASAKCFLKILEIHFINNKRGETSILACVCSSGHPHSPLSCSLCRAV